MKNLIFAVAAVSLSLVSCARREAKPDEVVDVSAPVPTEGKRGAPVAIDASLRDASAKLTLKFERDGEAVGAEVSGIDGLTLKSESALLQDQAVKAGETRSFDVAYARAAGRTNLVVSVHGRFAGAPLARVVTFAIGEGPLTQTGTRVVTNEGDALKVMTVPASP